MEKKIFFMTTRTFTTLNVVEYIGCDVSLYLYIYLDIFILYIYIYI